MILFSQANASAGRSPASSEMVSQTAAGGSPSMSAATDATARAASSKSDRGSAALTSMPTPAEGGSTTRSLAMVGRDAGSAVVRTPPRTRSDHHPLAADVCERPVGHIEMGTLGPSLGLLRCSVRYHRR